MEQLVLDAIISKQLEKKNVIRSSQHIFTKGNLCSTTLVAFCDVVTVLINEGRYVPCLSEAFDTISHNILVKMSRKCGIDG